MYPSRISQGREPRSTVWLCGRERTGHFGAILLLGLGLLWWVEPACAQGKLVSHPLTISIYPALQLTQNDVETILNGASDILQGKNTNITPPNSCKVEFQFSAFVPFPKSAPGQINTPADLEAVQSVPADVKIVQNINYCDQEVQGFYGCAWRAGGRQRTVIIDNVGISVGVGSVALAHEYGHTTGLLHRYDNDDFNLMSPCALDAYNQLINQQECAQFISGPVSQYPSGSGDLCPANFSARPRHY